MSCIVIIFSSLAFVMGCAYFSYKLVAYEEYKNHIAFLKWKKERLANSHECKYNKDDDLIKCYERKGEENCINCPFIPFEEECKYYGV